MKATKRKDVARIFPAITANHRGEARAAIVELHVDDTAEQNTVSLRLNGCRRRNTFKVSDLLNGKLLTDKLTLLTKCAVEYRGKKRAVIFEIDLETGLLVVRLHGLKERKTYSLADLFSWGPQLNFDFSTPPPAIPTSQNSSSRLTPL